MRVSCSIFKQQIWIMVWTNAILLCTCLFPFLRQAACFVSLTILALCSLVLVKREKRKEKGFVQSYRYCTSTFCNLWWHIILKSSLKNVFLHDLLALFFSLLSFSFFAFWGILLVAHFWRLLILHHCMLCTFLRWMNHGRKKAQIFKHAAGYKRKAKNVGFIG